MKPLILVFIGILFISGFFFISQNSQSHKQIYGQEVVNSFNLWCDSYGVTYNNKEERSYRLSVYNQNYQKILTHNANQDASYLLGVNQFMTLTQEEFAEKYLTLIDQGNNVPKQYEIQTPSNDVNWVQKGAVTPVKNQGTCGSCWAFSSTGCLEGISAIWGGGLQSFSEQQLIDCSYKYGNMGCFGGLMDNAFKYVIQNGIVTEAEYPYTGYGIRCKINQGPFKIQSYTDVPSGDCNSLVTALNKQPISVAVDAQNWQLYSSGIFNNCATKLDHGVLAVGYVSNSYWLIKNSWGTSWGEQGYIQLAWGNTCGLCNTASYGNY